MKKLTKRVCECRKKERVSESLKDGDREVVVEQDTA